MNGTELAFTFGLEPAKAVEHLRGKGLAVSGAWRSVSESAHAKAFTVANVTQLDVLKDIQDELLRAQKAGLTLDQFRDQLVPTLTKKGWFAAKGEPARVPDGTPPDPQTGELATRKRLTARRLQTIFQTNMQSSMMAGRYRELIANADKRPWFQYVAILDGRTRPAHRAMNGRVFRFDDPGWRVWWPPCGWGCRCRVRALDDEDLADKSLTPESSEGRLRDSSVPLPDGSTSTVTRYTPASGPSFAPDPGFNGNPAMQQAADRLAVARAPEVLPPRQAETALRELFTHPTRKHGLEAFAADAQEAGLRSGASRGAEQGIGALDDAAVLRLIDEGQTFDQAQPITLAADVIASRAEPLAPELWAEVPQLLAYGSTSWDAQRQVLHYVGTSSLLPRDQVLRVAVVVSAEANAVRSVEALPAGAIPAGVRVRPPVSRP